MYRTVSLDELIQSNGNTNFKYVHENHFRFSPFLGPNFQRMTKNLTYLKSFIFVDVLGSSYASN